MRSQESSLCSRAEFKRDAFCDEAVGQPVEGTILEIGAGSGMWADVFAKVVEQARNRGGNGPTKIYGVETNYHSAAALQQRREEVGLAGIYVGVAHRHRRFQ